MQETRVTKLTYTIQSEPHTVYKISTDQTFSNALGTFLLRQGALDFKPAENFDTPEEARSALEPFLGSWEAAVSLRFGPGLLTFKFDSAEVQEAASAVGGTAKSVGLSSAVAFTDQVHATATKSQYPLPIPGFEKSLAVETAIRRWQAFQKGRESLLVAGYAIFSLLFPTPREAATKYKIDIAVLRKVSELTSTRGTPTDFRKAPQNGIFIPLADRERAWLEAALPRLIFRVGEINSDSPLPRINMSDLPSL